MDLPYYNSTSYPLSVKEQLLNIPYTDEDAKELKYHQFITNEYFTKNKHARGLLVCYGMGFGKTRLAVSIANHYRKTDKNRKVIVLLSKSLEGNFRNSIREFTKESDEYIDKNYRFVSLNASNMFKQMQVVDKTKEEVDYEKRLGDLMSDVKKNNSLNNSLLIIDEAHNLFNAITNGAKNATALYDLIIESINLK
jgi:Rad3-related DNA helicase